MAFYMRSTAMAVVLGVGLALPAAAQNAQQQQQPQQESDQCWSEMSQFDRDGDGMIGSTEFSENGEDIFGILDEDGNGEITREEFEKCLLAGEQPRTDQRFDDFDKDADGVVVREDIVAADQSGSAEGAQIRVQQPQPEVTVQQPQPEVQVEQAQPQVEVTQPKPQVEVTQPQPQVQVEQGQPQVQVEQGQPQVQVEPGRPEVQVEQAQPEVQVEQAQPEVQVEQERSAEQPETTASEQAQQREPQDAETTVITPRETTEETRTPTVTESTETQEKTFDLSRFSADDLMGMNVVNVEGENIGDVEDVVVDANDQVFFIVSVGGFLGIGERNIALPADEFEAGEDQLVFQTQRTEDELKEMPAYDASQFEKHNW